MRISDWSSDVCSADLARQASRMSGYSLDANILIDALLDHRPAYREMTRIAESGARMWIRRIAWIEALSKGEDAAARAILSFLSSFGLDEIEDEIAHRAAALRRGQVGRAHI